MENSTLINEILNEISQCREDERNSQNQIVQVIAAAGAMLGVIFTASIFQQRENVEMILDQHILMLLSIFIFCTIFTYITTLGIQNVLRYHYIQGLEDYLAELSYDDISEEGIVQWMSFCSPITTRNIKHVNHGYTGIHYFCYALATLFAALFCGSVVLFQYINIDQKSRIDVAGMAISVAVIMLCVLSFFIISFKAKDMYEYAFKISMEKKIGRLIERSKAVEKVKQNETVAIEKKNHINLKQRMLALGYFVYPKISDPQKPAIILVGFIVGLYQMNTQLTWNLFCDEIKNMIMVWFVLDVLVYQARYQWNDIRGLAKDQEAGKIGRLPAMILGKKKSVILSWSVLFGKLILAGWLIYSYREIDMRPLLICSCLTILFAILYEAVRSLEFDLGVFVLVSFGYPLRFLAGFWAAYPSFWNGVVVIDTKNIPCAILILLLLIAYGCIGEFSVLLPWTHEAIFQVDKMGYINKSHYNYLFTKVYERHQNSTSKKLKKSFPLKEKGKIADPWNVMFLIAQVLLSILVLMLGISGKSIFFELLLIANVVFLCLSSMRNVTVAAGLYIISTFVKLAISFWTSGWSAPYCFISVNQAVAMVLYVYLRYAFSIDFDMATWFKEALVKLAIAATGRETWEYLKNGKN